MTPEEILEEVAGMLDEDEEINQFPTLKPALIGWAEPWQPCKDGKGAERPVRLIYSAAKCIKVFMERDGMDYEEALEWLTTNTEGGYLGPHTPIIMYGEEF